MSEDRQATPSLISKAEEFLKRAKKNFRFTYVNDGAPPAGYIDLFVYSLKKGEKFDLSNKFIYIDGMSSLLNEVRKACSGGKRIRNLRIMGHGSIGGFRIGRDETVDSWVGRAELYEGGDLQGKKTALYRDFESLKEFFDAEKSVVILDHCQTGASENALIRFSTILGGVNVRAFLDYQYWEHSDVQFGQGVYRQCAGKECHLGVELVQS